MTWTRCCLKQCSACLQERVGDRVRKVFQSVRDKNAEMGGETTREPAGHVTAVHTIFALRRRSTIAKSCSPAVKGCECQTFPERVGRQGAVLAVLALCHASTSAATPGLQDNPAPGEEEHRREATGTST